VTYVVQSGDTLNAIGARYGTTAQAIMAANGLTSEIIQVGQVLIIPVP
jgi:N-acetylmuramoyl-L-alanine amidase